MRLRRAESPHGSAELKLTQKVPAARPGTVQGLVTNIYLSPAEYDVLATLPARALTKTRFSVPPLGIDVFAGRLRGLVLAEAEFATDTEAESFAPPSECVAEVTDDARFTGGRLVRAARAELLTWLAEYGIRPGVCQGSRRAASCDRITARRHPGLGRRRAGRVTPAMLDGHFARHTAPF